MTDNGKTGETVDWSRFGLDPVGQSSPPRSNNHDPSSLTARGSTASGNPNVKDLFDEEQVKKKSQMLILTLSDLKVTYVFLLANRVDIAIVLDRFLVRKVITLSISPRALVYVQKSD